MTYNINANNMEELRLFVEQMRSTSSSLDKVEILKQQSDFIKKVLEYTYNPYKQYYVTSKTCKKNSDLCDPNKIHDTIFDLLDDLTNRVYTGHDAIAMVNSFTLQNNGYEDDPRGDDENVYFVGEGNDAWSLAKKFTETGAAYPNLLIWSGTEDPNYPSIEIYMNYLDKLDIKF